MAKRGLDHWADILVVVLYLLLVLGVGLWSIFRPKRGNVKTYFLAGGSMLWIHVGASLFSSNIGAEHFVGLAGTGAAAGISIVLYEWFPGILVILLGWFFLPVYISSGVYTMPEYLEKRFGGKRIRTYISVFSLFMYILTKLSTSIFSGALYIQLALGWNMYLAIGVLLFLTGLFTILGGLTAVMYTDTLQSIIMMFGSLFVAGYAYSAIGGYKKLEVRYLNAMPLAHNNTTTCAFPRDDAFHILRDPVTSDNPWPGFLMQTTFGCIWYWCCDQVMVQRTLAAKNLSHAKGGTLMTCILKITPLFIMVMPGMISRALYPEEVACTDPDVCREVCDNSAGCSNIAYPKLVLELLPVGLRGLLMAVMMSAVISSLTSVFNSAGSVFTLDIWTRIRPKASQRELLIIGRITVVVLCLITILWLPMVKSSQGGQIFIYLNAVQAYFGTPVGMVYLWGILWKRCTEKVATDKRLPPAIIGQSIVCNVIILSLKYGAAFSALLVSLGVGIIRLVLELVYPAPLCGEEDVRPAILAKVHYTYFGALSMIICSIVIVFVSLVTKPNPDVDLEGTTWWTRYRGLTKGEVYENKQLNIDATNDELDLAKLEIDHPVAEVPSVCQHWINTVCGIPDSGTEEDSSDHQQQAKTIDEIRKFLTESSRDKTILNTVAALTVIVIAFLFGFYH